jgi:hypothetical protein
MPRRFVAFLITISALVLAACGGGSAPPTPTSAPLERPTSTPRPTVTPKAEPTAKPEPTAEPEPTKEPEATPKPIDGNNGSGDLAKVEIGDFVTYTHPDGLFSIDVPENWASSDSSNPAVAAVTWTDPANNALVIVFVTEESSELNQDELGERLQAFIDSYQEEPDFSSDPAENLESGGVQIIWSYTATADEGVQAPLLFNSFVYQDGDKISMLTFGVPDDQFPDLKDSLDIMLNSYTIDPAVALDAAPVADDDLPDAELYDFSDNKGDWVEEDTGEVSAERSGGVYTVGIVEPDQYYMLNPDMDIGSEQGIAVTVEPGGDSRAGVFVRLRSSNGSRDYYACWIDANSQYGCFVSVDNDWTTLQDATESSELQAGAPNRIKLTMYGDQLTFYINGVEVFSTIDDTVTDGRAGLYLENFADPVTAVYDDVAISSK